MSDKKLTISVDAKIAPGVQQLKKLMEDINGGSNKLAKAAGTAAGIGGEGGSVTKQGALAKALLGNKKLFDDLGKSGERLAKILNTQVTKSQATLTKQLEESTRKLDPLMKKYEAAISRVEGLKQRGVDPSRIQLAERYAGRAGRAVTIGAAEHQLARTELGMLADQAPGAAGGGGIGRGGASGLLSMLMGRAGVPGAGMLMGMGGAAAGGAALAAGVALGYKMSLSAMAAPIEASASLGGSRGQMYGELAGFSMPQLFGRGKRAIGVGGEGLGVGGWASRVGNWSLAVGQSIISQDWSDPAEAARKNIAAADLERESARAGKLGAAEAASLAQIQQQHEAGLVRKRWRYGRKFFGAMNKQSEALGSGISGMELSGYADALAPFTGARSASGLTQRVGAAVLAGMDPGQAASIVGAGAIGRGNVLGYGGGLDPTMRGILGSGAVNNMGPGSMMFAGAGNALADALAGAVSTSGGPAGVRQAQQAVMGAGLYGQVFAGHDPYQKSYNIAAATAALGEGASPYARNFLATQMGDPKVLAEVLAGRIPDSFKSILPRGTKVEQLQSMARDVDRGLISGRWFDTGEDSVAADRMREMRRAGGPQQWLRGMPASERDQAIREAAPLWSQSQMGLTGGEVGAGEAALRMAGGFGSPASGRRSKGGKGPAPVVDEDYLDEANRAAVRTKNLITDAETNAEKFNTAMKTLAIGANRVIHDLGLRKPTTTTPAPKR